MRRSLLVRKKAKPSIVQFFGPSTKQKSYTGLQMFSLVSSSILFWTSSCSCLSRSLSDGGDWLLAQVAAPEARSVFGLAELGLGLGAAFAWVSGGLAPAEAGLRGRRLGVAGWGAAVEAASPEGGESASH